MNIAQTSATAQVQASSSTVREDRILKETKLGAALVVPFLVAASIILYLFPGNTTELFAWTIKPSMTPLMLGAAYGAGIYFFMVAQYGEDR